MRVSWKVSVAVALCLTLSACGGGKIDSRQADWNNGLAYKHGSTDPFTGTIQWKDSVPTTVLEFWNQYTLVNGPAMINGCDVAYVKGSREGPASCSAPDGKVLLKLTFKNERVDGPSDFYSPTTGDLNHELMWNAGTLDGVQKTYTDDGKQLLAQISMKNGFKDGITKLWDEAGALIGDQVWSTGKIVSGKVINRNEEVTYKDGQLDGPATTYQVVMKEGGEVARVVTSKGQYVMGKRVGTWQDKASSSEGQKIFQPVFLQVGAQWPVSLMRMENRLDHSTSNWVDGEAEGQLKGFDDHDQVLIQASIKNGQVEGPIQISDDGSTARRSTVQDGKATAGVLVTETQPGASG